MTVSKEDKDIRNAIAHRGENGGQLEESQWCFVKVGRLDELERFAEVGKMCLRARPAAVAALGLNVLAWLWVAGAINPVTVGVTALVAGGVILYLNGNARWF